MHLSLAHRLTLGLTVAACRVGSPPATAADQKVADTGTGAVIAEVIGFKDDRGQALIAVFCAAPGFPDDVSKACAKTSAAIAKGQVRVTFPKISAGEYAVAVHHDENRNFKMDTGFFGIPKEGYGASRDARGRFGPPAFDDARLRLRPGATDLVRIRMTY